MAGVEEAVGVEEVAGEGVVVGAVLQGHPEVLSRVEDLQVTTVIEAEFTTTTQQVPHT